MTRGLALVVLTAALTALTGAAGSAGEAVEIRLRGHYYTAPATVQLIIAVEPNADNRLLRVEADGDEMYCSTDLPLEGAREKRLHMVEFKNLRAGQYTVRAQLMAESAVRAEATQHVRVMGGDDEGW